MAVIAVFILSLPVAWLLMLFLGNLGLNLSFWGTLPGAVIIATLGGASSNNE